MIYTLIEFAERMALENKDPFVSLPYLEELCQALEDCATGNLPNGARNLGISIAPRHYKTSFASRAFPAWCYGEIAADCEFISTSYGAELAVDNTMAVKKIVKAEWYKVLYPGVHVSREDKDIQKYFKTTAGGSMYGAGMDGTITGFGAGKNRAGFGGAIIIDDPLKAKDARSPNALKTCVDNYTGTLLSRRNNIHTTPIIVIMQRLDESVLLGWIRHNECKEEPNDWHFVNFPARENGKVLNPYTTSNEQLDKMQTYDPVTYYSQYMQRPDKGGKNRFRREYWKYYSVLPKLTRKIIYADTALKDKEQNDYSVFACWAQSWDKQLYLLDILRGKWEAPELLVAAKAFFEKHRSTHKCFCSAVKVEDKASGTGLIQQLKRKEHGALPVIPIPREVDKYTRSQGTIPYVEAGHVHLPENAPWLRDFLEEHDFFPNFDHDDQVDTTMDAIEDMLGGVFYDYENLL